MYTNLILHLLVSNSSAEMSELLNKTADVWTAVTAKCRNKQRNIEYTDKLACRVVVRPPETIAGSGSGPQRRWVELPTL